MDDRNKQQSISYYIYRHTVRTRDSSLSGLLECQRSVSDSNAYRRANVYLACTSVDLKDAETGSIVTRCCVESALRGQL